MTCTKNENKEEARIGPFLKRKCIKDADKIEVVIIDREKESSTTVTGVSRSLESF